MQNVFLSLHCRPLIRLLVGIYIYLIIITMLLAGTSSFQAAHAADQGGGTNFSLQPVLYDVKNPVTKSYFVFDSRPNTVLHNRVRVTNSGTATGTVHLYPVDATTGQTSGLVYLSKADVRRDVGAWVTIGVQQLTLTPGQSQVVPFQVTIPGTVRPGQHVGGLVAASLTSDTAPKNRTLRINVQNLSIIAVQVNLPGTPIEQLVATGIQSSGANNYQSLLVGLRNTGTQMLKSSGTLQVADDQGHLLQNLPMHLDTFLPDTAIDYPVYVQKQALGAGNYRAILTLTYGHAHMLQYTTVFTITQQQLNQVFTSSGSLQLPGNGGNILSRFSSEQLLIGILIVILIVSSVLPYCMKKLYRFARTSLLGGRGKK